MKSRIMNIFQIREIIGILLLGFILTCCMKTVVNNVADSFTRQSTVTIRIPDNVDSSNNSVVILYEAKDGDLFPELKNACDKNDTGWIYFEGESGVSWTTLSSDRSNAQISISAKLKQSSYIAFLSNKWQGRVIIESEAGSEEVNCYIDQDSSEIIRFYPYNNIRAIFESKILIYIFIFIIIISLLGLFVWFIKNNKLLIPEPLMHRPTIADYFILWFLLFVFAVFIYKVIGIPNYLQVGDEGTYWNTLLLKNGKWDTGYLASLFTPRGYWCYVLQTIAKFFGEWLEIDASIIWMVFPSATISWFSTVIMPDLYQCLTNTVAKRIHVIPIVIVLLTTWNLYLTSVLMDMFGVVTLFACLAYILKYFRKQRYIDAVWAGIIGGISCSFRVANLWGIVAVAVYGFWKGRKEAGLKQLKKFIGLLLAIAMFLLISIPQVIINNERGHFGFLPYDHDEAWYGRSSVIWSSDYAMTNGNVAYPVLATDDQMRSMKSQIYDNSAVLTMDQLLGVYMYSPIESLMLIIKKLVIGFDIKTNIAYPLPGDPVPWRETSGMVFSLWNYFVLYCSLYVLLHSRKINKKERVVAMLIFATLVLPETFMKIEWRYVIAGYMCLYYFFSFHFCEMFFIGSTGEKNILENTNFLIGLAIFMMVYLTCSFTFLA